MRELATIDLETDPFKFGRIPQAFASCVFVRGISSVFWGEDCCRSVVEKCLQEAKKRKDGLLVYAHNGGKFDFHFLLPALLANFEAADLEIMAIGARIVKIKTPICEFRDSFALIPKPLKSFGAKKEIQIEKLEADVRDKNRKEIVDYLIQDCVGLHDGLTKFFEQYGAEITLASTTFKVLKEKFGMKPPRTAEEYDTKFRNFYFAGRVQFFPGYLGKNGETDGKKRFQICDINSAFPAAMMFPHWFSAEYSVSDKAPKVGFEQSFFRIVCDSQGCLPKRSEGGGVEFPIVEREEFFATGWELKAGLDLGLIHNLRIKCVYTPAEVKDFSGYVSHFYDLKKNAPNPAERDFAKLFLNSAYGKFALNPREFRDVTITKWGEVPSPKKIERKNGTMKEVDWSLSFDDMARGLSFWQCPSNDEEAKKPMRFYNVCTAASITGAVRAFLQRSISACKGVAYCDTDSIIAEDTSALKLSDELGDWKLEKECDAVWIGGKKLYAAHDYQASAKKIWKTASKGVRLKVEDLVAVCEGEARSCSFDAPNYSVFSAPSFTTRTVRRDDKRKKR